MLLAAWLIMYLMEFLILMTEVNMKEEALQQAKKLYRDLLEHFGNSPMKIALAFEFIHEDSELADRRKACSRVGMWAQMGVPKKFSAKAEEFLA